MLIAAVLFILVGLAHIIFPEVMWYLAHGIFDKNAEPGDNTEIIYRIGGGLAVIVGIIAGIGGLK
ncbi:MAG: hypothetical protein J6C96_03305 [Oscillospiraceae bacterium]|nr:hypothetical protein [Oscillospiraceae bacterium]